MNAQALSPRVSGRMPALGASTPQVRTLLLTDIVDSTSLVEKLGDTASADLFRAHDRLVLELQQRWRGRLIDRSDGLLLLFERPVDGLGFALDYVRGLRDLGNTVGHVLRARAGLHVGEVLIWENSAESVRYGAKPVEVEGLAKPLAGRLMAMARPGQILLSAVAEPLAHRAARELGERGEQLVWKSYGRWMFKGVPESQEVFEVGEPAFAPLRAPPNSAKAWRDVPLWRRPAALVAEAVLLVAIGIGVWTATRPQPAIAFNERDWVVVGDLRNLTGDARLDDALDQAFRISLEQSSYVNVLSDLKVRETLERMQRKPGTPVDRAVGAEVALRDGARALILPTVSEVGGRLRVSAEVVDPQTQTTVHALSADGRGVDSALASIDTVTAKLRGQLGEALAAVQKTALPLPNVSTPSLDALKLYALGHKAEGEGKDKEALGWYNEALTHDPQFALAYGAIGAMQARNGLEAQAQASFAKALALPNRLSAQEADRYRLWQAWFGPYEPQLALLKRYVSLYPDDPFGYAGLRTVHSMLGNDWPQAVQAAQRGLALKGPRRGTQLYALGSTLLGANRPAEAIQAFEQSRAEGFHGDGGNYAHAYDALREYAKADALRAGTRITDLRDGMFPLMEQTLVDVDRGRWRQAASRMHAAWATANADDRRDWYGPWLGSCVLAQLTPAATCLDRARAYLQDSANALAPERALDRKLGTAIWAASVGDAKRVKELLAGLDAAAVNAQPMRRELQQVVQAELLRLGGQPAKAIAALQPLAARPTATIATHAALLRAAQVTGNTQLAAKHSGWLLQQRGRAFTESSADQMLFAYNVAQVNVGLLADVELAVASGDSKRLAIRRSEMAKAWPGTPEFPSGLLKIWHSAAKIR